MYFLTEIYVISEGLGGADKPVFCFRTSWASCGRAGEIEKAQKYLEDAEALYNQYMREIGTAPYDPQEHFMAEEEMLSEQERHKRFEKVATQTLYYLAQVYKHLDMDEKAARYCHTTLQRQLETRDYNPVEWTINAATLSQYYISKVTDYTAQASHGLMVQCVHKTQHSVLAAGEDAVHLHEQNLHDWLGQKKSDISRCWIKYCLFLLQDSRKLLEDDIAELDPERQDELRAQQAREEEEKERGRKKAVQFGSSETFDSILSAEEKVTCLYPVDFQSARQVFLFGQSHVLESKKFFQLDGHTRDHVEVVQDHSALFKALAFFEEDHERRCKMHKRRVDMLEAVHKELNPQYYLLVCRQLQFEIADAYYQMMMLKVTIANGLEDLDQRNIKKINHLAHAAISSYQLFLDSLRDADKQFPSELESDVLRPALFAKFRMGYLHNKIITAEPRGQLENTQNSLDCYSFVVDYCQSHEEAIAAVEMELELCTEMTGLLAARVKQLRTKLLAEP
uniref:KIF-binding protein n=1 Tax=Callorhinchus milii TaxID=7868 RepID=A0A4W3K3E0_CALMI